MVTETLRAGSSVNMSSAGEAKFWERASRVFCEGEVSAATETVPSTVMLWANSPTFRVSETF